MPQQINLCTPILLKQKRYFSARTMLVSLAVFVLLGGVLTAYGAWSVNSAARAIQATLTAQAVELTSLRNAIVKAPSPGAHGEPALARELQSARAQLTDRQSVLLEWRRGLTAAGQGHSARLQMVAQSIPAQVWITHLRADDSQLELQGFTEDPGALNAWVAKLAQSPLLRGQQLARVKVELALVAATVNSVRNDRVPGASGVAAARPVWSFTLATGLSSLGQVAAGVRP